MSSTGMEDSVTTSLVTVDDHAGDKRAYFIQDPHLQPSMTLQQCVVPDSCAVLYEYLRPDSHRLWAMSGDIPFCLWHDRDALRTYCSQYSQRSSGTDTELLFDVGIAHQHSDPSKVCFAVSTRHFWETYRVSCAIPDNNLPPLYATTGFVLNVLPTLPASQLCQPVFQVDESSSLDTLYGQAYLDDNDSRHSTTPVAMAKQERDIRPLRRTSTRRRGAPIRDHTLSTQATAAKRQVPYSVETRHKTTKRVKLSLASPVASTSSSSLTDPSSSPPLSLRTDSPSPSREDRPLGVGDLRCILPDCSERFSSVDLVIDHHKSVHPGGYPGMYRCAFESCNHLFNRKADFSRHAESLCHQPDKGYSCTGCDSTFTRSDALERHQTKARNVKPECREEGKKAKTKHVKDRKKGRRSNKLKCFSKQN